MAVHDVQIFRLHVESQFDGLTNREKHYAHHMARAAWHGARIVLRQVSPESSAIFDFILEFYRQCSGDWHLLTGRGISENDVQSFLKYAATFLSNVGNYFGSGDQKFIPDIDTVALEKIAQLSPKLQSLYKLISVPLYALPPFSLGFPNEMCQSSYYTGQHVTKTEVALVSKVLEQNSIYPENTRLRKTTSSPPQFEVLVASVEEREPSLVDLPDHERPLKIVWGDHSEDLKRVSIELAEASKYAANDLQKKSINECIASFRTGSLGVYRESQRTWVKDKAPKVENIFGFVEPYRDPHGTRAEFEALVAIADENETRLLGQLVEWSATFIRRLPWATPENNGKGPFEHSVFDPPDFSSIHALAYCSSIIFPGINLPNYNDIRQVDGFKNVIIANRMAVESLAKQYPFIDASEANQFKKFKFTAYYWWVVCHELFGHGTGRMMVESEDGTCNFDIKDPPLDPITEKPITSWYKPGQTWTGQFGDLATTVDECRAELVGAYLMDDPELLALVGISGTSIDEVHDVTYNLYQQLGVDGLRGLVNYNVDSGKWGQAHSRAHFAILRCLLLDGGGVVRITHDKSNDNLTVHVDRSRIRSGGKEALKRMLLRLHIFRSTADAAGCREYYEDLSRVEGQAIEWRQTVLANKPAPLVFVQANTFVQDDKVVLKEYNPTVEGVIQSWVERDI